MAESLSVWYSDLGCEYCRAERKPIRVLPRVSPIVYNPTLASSWSLDHIRGGGEREMRPTTSWSEYYIVQVAWIHASTGLLVHLDWHHNIAQGPRGAWSCSPVPPGPSFSVILPFLIFMSKGKITEDGKGRIAEKEPPHFSFSANSSSVILPSPASIPKP